MHLADMWSFAGIQAQNNALFLQNNNKQKIQYHNKDNSYLSDKCSKAISS